jgi:hypothetical protein
MCIPKFNITVVYQLLFILGLTLNIYAQANSALQPTLQSQNYIFERPSTVDETLSPSISLSEIQTELEKFKITSNVVKKDLIPSITKSEIFLDNTSLNASYKKPIEKNERSLIKKEINPIVVTQNKAPTPVIPKYFVEDLTTEQNEEKPISPFDPLSIQFGIKTFRIDSARRNPVTVIQGFPVASLHIGILRLSYGINLISEPDPIYFETDYKGYLDETNLKNQIFELGLHKKWGKLATELSGIRIISTGEFLGIELKKSETIGIFFNIKYFFTSRLSYYVGISPYLINQWTYKEETGSKIYDTFKGEKNLSSQHYGNVLTMGINWTLKSWSKNKPTTQ